MAGLADQYLGAHVSRTSVPTFPAFAASNTATWFDLHASRDLFAKAPTGAEWQN
ncbi:hypothetical protein [Mycobacterium vicinigordonae]|uniref:hypothetical protein n=1 Tax=Mycobacterium vicinigordonae TaxID=1719132 RepID=UPI001FE45AEE|nr:hypothetical protein [Mycobacterium vicinigordonae]